MPKNATCLARTGKAAARGDFYPNAEDHAQKKAKATEAEGLPNWKLGILSSPRFVRQVVRALLSLFAPGNPIPVFGFYLKELSRGRSFQPELRSRTVTGSQRRFPNLLYRRLPSRLTRESPGSQNCPLSAGLETRDTADLEVCATNSTSEFGYSAKDELIWMGAAEAKLDALIQLRVTCRPVSERLKLTKRARGFGGRSVSS